MKRATALRYSRELASRVLSVNGLIPTPFGKREHVKVSRVWIFGSTAKGSQFPNDLDVLIELEVGGNRQKWEDVGIDKRYLHSYGVKQPKCSRSEAIKWLRKGMKLVSVHCTDVECAEIDVKRLIYPSYEMPNE